MSQITLIGIDTSKSVFHLMGINRKNELCFKKKVNRNKFLSTLANIPTCCIVIEACAVSHHWARSIRDLGHEAKIIAPQHVKAYRRGQKNDFRDAEAILSAAIAPGMHFVGVKTMEQQAEQALHRVRSRLLSHRNATAIELRGLLAEYGVSFGLGVKTLQKGARKFVSSELAQTLGLVTLVNDVLEEIEYLNQRVDQYEKLIQQRVRSSPVSTHLEKELRGVGILSASALRVKVADARDFGNGRNFAAYLGLAPGHRGTGGKVKIGKLKRGHDLYIRQLLIHGGRSVVRHLGDKQDPQSCWLRELVARRGPNVAAVAMAHKNARQAWAILAREQELAA